MPLRVIEIVTPSSDRDVVTKSLEEHRPDEGYVYWSHELDNDSIEFRVILQVEESEPVLDKLERMFTWTDEYRIVVYPAEATLPRLKTDPPPDKQVQSEQAEDADNSAQNHDRISREELYTDVFDNARPTASYFVLVAFAAVVAVIGLSRDSVAVIIGAMVLAPLLGPNVGLSLSAALGDTDLLRLSLKTLASGVAVVLAVSAISGLIFGLPAGSFEFLDRIHASYADIVLAVVSGGAGIVSVTLGTPTGLVGVMVALSLLPPLAACGMSLGAGQFVMAAGSAALFVTNIICLNIAGVVTFLVQGIQPLSWWERKRARGMVLRVGALWTTMLVVLCVLLYFRIV